MTISIDPPGVWVSCADLAKRKGVTRQAITKRVAYLETQGKITTRKQGRSRLVEMAAYDRAVGEVGDAIREIGTETRHKIASPALRDAQTERAQYEAQLKALDLAERQNKVLPIDGPHGIRAASQRVGDTLSKSFDGLARHAEDIAAAVSVDGVVGARRILKQIAITERTKISTMLLALAKEGEAAEQAGLIETHLNEGESDE